ncbi:hypothetical protein WG908_04410 [Sphingobium sp. AN641]|uniref:hypothetical protein n=1 Tax=Sphingobium sp. AN641 TaxID=3133443 RepID=UPI0030C35EA8
MPKDPNMEAANERMRQQKIDDRRDENKKHGENMDRIAQGGSRTGQGSGGGCPLIILCLLAPFGIYVADRLI